METAGVVSVSVAGEAPFQQGSSQQAAQTTTGAEQIPSYPIGSFVSQVRQFEKPGLMGTPSLPPCSRFPATVPMQSFSLPKHPSCVPSPAPTCNIQVSPG